ncbi:MAG: hypothetical protein ACYCVH_14630, partial [Ignavibacteriaceae bacterium]
MKKVMIILSLMFSVASLYGQSKNNLPNYGYKLMPIRVLTPAEKELMAQHQFSPTRKLAKIDDLP